MAAAWVNQRTEQVKAMGKGKAPHYCFWTTLSGRVRKKSFGPGEAGMMLAARYADALNANLRFGREPDPSEPQSHKRLSDFTSQDEVASEIASLVSRIAELRKFSESQFGGRRKCEECGKLFVPAKPHQVVCCGKCRHARETRKRLEKNPLVRPMLPKATCQVCGKRFKPKCRTHVLCSDPCRHTAKIGKSHEYMVHRSKPQRRPDGKLTVFWNAHPCRHCGRHFMSSSGASRFCGDECRRAARANRESESLAFQFLSMKGALDAIANNQNQ